MLYPEAIERAGGIPVIVPLLRPDAIDSLLDRVDGVCLPGGPDLQPSIYRAKPHPELGPTEPRVDALELALVRAADRRNLPILGICRGMQVSQRRSGRDPASAPSRCRGRSASASPV